MTIPAPINFPKWIEENQHLLQPPVGNQQLYMEAQDFIVMVIGGPNARTDYHVDPYEEWFYQVRGDIIVRVMTDNGPQDVHIREGEMWLLPRDTPHSPQRPEAGSIGIVLERIREKGTLERFQWYCPNCNALIHDVELQVTDIVTDLLPVFDNFYADEAARTCGQCGTIHPDKA